MITDVQIEEKKQGTCGEMKEDGLEKGARGNVLFWFVMRGRI